MGENNVNLLQVTSTSDAEGIIDIPNTINEFVKRAPIKLPPVITDGENDAVQKGRIEDAWEDDAIIQSCLRLHGSRDTLSNYTLNEEEEKIAKKKIVRKSKKGQKEDAPSWTSGNTSRGIYGGAQAQ